MSVASACEGQGVIALAGAEAECPTVFNTAVERRKARPVFAGPVRASDGARHTKHAPLRRSASSLEAQRQTNGKLRRKIRLRERDVAV